MLNMIKQIKFFIFSFLIVILSYLAYTHISFYYHNNIRYDKVFENCQIKKQICNQNQSGIYNYTYNCEYNCSTKVKEDIKNNKNDLSIFSIIIILFSIVLVSILYYSLNDNKRSNEKKNNSSLNNKNSKSKIKNKNTKSKKITKS